MGELSPHESNSAGSEQNSTEENTNSRGKHDGSLFAFHSCFQPQSSGFSPESRFLPSPSLMKGDVRHFLMEGLITTHPDPHLHAAALCLSPGCGGSSSELMRWGWKEGTSHGAPGRKTPRSSEGNPAVRVLQALRSGLGRKLWCQHPKARVNQELWGGPVGLAPRQACFEANC